MSGRAGLVMGVLMGVAACGSHDGSQTPRSAADPLASMSLEDAVNSLINSNAIAPHGDGVEAPCATTGDCERLCSERDNGWACLLTADALRADGNEIDARSRYRRACSDGDPDGCAEAAISEVHATGGRGASRQPYADLYVACTVGLSARACAAFPLLRDRRAWQEASDADSPDLAILHEVLPSMLAEACSRHHVLAACRETGNYDILCDEGHDPAACQAQATARAAAAERDRADAEAEAARVAAIPKPDYLDAAGCHTAYDLVCSRIARLKDGVQARYAKCMSDLADVIEACPHMPCGERFMACAQHPPDDKASVCLGIAQECGVDEDPE